MFSQFQPNYSLGCNETLKTNGHLGQCVFGEPGATAPSIMLWGDSHANHYLPAIAKIAAAHGVKGIARIHVDCRPFITPDAIDVNSARRRSCLKSNEEALTKLLTGSEISVVVLAARWDARDVNSAEVNELDTFTKNIERTITELERNGKKVVILGQVPLFARNLKNCLTKQAWFGHKIPDCEWSSSPLVSSYKTGILNSMQKLSQKHRQAAFFAPENYLCDASACLAIDEQGRPLYVDDDHLSSRGAYFLRPYINETIEHLLRNVSPKMVQSELP